MKFIINREEILKPLSKLNNHLSNNLKELILSNVLIRLNFNLLILIVTDLDIEIRFYLKLLKKNVFKNGITTVSIRKLYDLFRNFPEKSEITINLLKNKLKISCFQSISLFSTLPESNFPIFTKNLLFNYKFQISFVLLKKIMESIYFSIGNQDIRFYLNGVLIEFKENKLFFVSTDGYRMSICKVSQKKFILNKKQDFYFVISRKLSLEILNFLSSFNYEKNIFFELNNKIIKIYLNNFIIYSKLMDGTFPDYKSILISTKDYKFVNLNVLDLKNCLLRTLVISSLSFNYVTFFFQKNLLEIFSVNSNNDEIKEKLLIDYKFADFKVSFNVKYILDVLNSIKNSYQIRFYFKDNISVIKINSYEDSFINYMIMPIKF